MALMPAPPHPISFLPLFLCLLFSAAHQAPLLLPLNHALSKSPDTTTVHHLLRSSTLRSAARFHSRRRRARLLLQSSPDPRRAQVSLPLSPGSDYTLSLSIGSARPETVELFMDTGSDLVWLPCAPFECILCEGKQPPSPLSVAASREHSPVSCSSPSCSAAHSNMPSSDLCAIAGCPLDDLETSGCSTAYSCPPFYYAYGDGSLVARLRRAHLGVEGVAGKQNKKPALLQLANFTFGCAHSTLAEPVGVAGFGQGVLSMPAQLAKVSPDLGRQFSYCLISHSFQSEKLRRPSPLILGRASFEDDGSAPTEGGRGASSSSSSPVVYTPLLDNPKHPYFYSVGLDAISVGTRRIPSTPGLSSVDRHGNGGFVVDSGTTFTMLPTAMHALVAAAFDQTMKASGYRRATQAEQTTGLLPCFHHRQQQQQRANASDDEDVVMSGVPSLTLHLAGNASVTLPRRNYYVGFPTAGAGSDVGCLMLMGIASDESDSGPMGTLGNVQQQGFEVVFDLQRRRVGFAPKKCAALWDTLSRG